MDEVSPTQPSPPDETDLVVPVKVEDLDAIRAALNSAYYHQQTYDVMSGYRELATEIKMSPMTQALGRALTTVQAYLVPVEEEEEEVIANG